jgi:hypothetical protein
VTTEKGDHLSVTKQTPSAAVQIAKSNLPKLAPLGRKQVVLPIGVQSTRPDSRKLTAAPSRPVERRNTADYSSSSSESASNSSGDEKKRKYLQKGVPF